MRQPSQHDFFLGFLIAQGHSMQQYMAGERIIQLWRYLKRGNICSDTMKLGRYIN
jgi:hypothetical protein